MSIFFPHTPYAEEQPFFHAILAAHVLYRGFQSGALAGSLAPLPLMLFRPLSAPLPMAMLRSAGVGTVVGTSLLTLGLVGQMWGREEIEWRDRSWRLLENKGQMEVDTWSMLGTVAGGLLGRGGWRERLGGAGLGSLTGVMGYLGWRYGVKKGKWEDEKL